MPAPSQSLLVALTASCIACKTDAHPRGVTDRVDPWSDQSSDAAELSCHASVTGTIHMPNGVLPVSQAFVYLTTQNQPASRSGSCSQCLNPLTLASYATTAPDGSFELWAAPGTYRFFVEKGIFRRSAEVTVVSCSDDVALDPEATRLPRNNVEGVIPEIAVITGEFDRMEVVLARLGLGEVDASGRLVRSEFDVFAGRNPDNVSYSEGAQLIRDRARLLGYDYLFIDCGASVYSGSPEIVTNLQTFVEQGGRLYVTDLAFGYVEDAWPTAIGFVGSGSRGLGPEPEPYDLALAGDAGQVVVGTIHDDSLAAWLRVIGALEPDGSVQLTSWGPGWAVMQGVSPEQGRTWVSGDVSWTDWSNVTSVSGHQPLTVSFDRGCGRALFTSYHTIEVPEGEPTPPDLHPQELILGYLSVEIGACIDEPIVW